MRTYIDYNDNRTLPPVNKEIYVWQRLYGSVVKEIRRDAVMRHNFIGKAVFLGRDYEGLYTLRLNDVFAWEEKGNAEEKKTLESRD